MFHYSSATKQEILDHIEELKELPQDEDTQDEIEWAERIMGMM